MYDSERFQDDIDKARDLQSEQPRAGRGGTVPPVEHQFKPGQSGNPGGRPKRIFSDLLAAYLGMEDQRLARRFVRELFNQACKGNRTAIRFMISRLDRLNVELAPEDLEPADLELHTQAFLAEEAERERVEKAAKAKQRAAEREKQATIQKMRDQILRGQGVQPATTPLPKTAHEPGDICDLDGRKVRVQSCSGNVVIYDKIPDDKNASDQAS